MTNLDTTRKLKDTLTVWRNFTLFNFTNIHVFCLEVTLWVNPCQVVTIFIGSNNRISHVLNLTVRNDTNIFRKVNWTKRTEVSAKDLTCFIFCSWFKEISSKVVFQLHIVNLIITDKKGHHWFIISNEKQSLDGLFFWNIQESSNFIN